MTETAESSRRWSKVRNVVRKFVCRVRINLQDNKNTVNKKLTTIIEKLGIQVSHKAGDATLDLSKQGNPEMYTQSYLAQRANLRADPRVKEAINKMWDTNVSLSHFIISYEWYC